MRTVQHLMETYTMSALPVLQNLNSQALLKAFLKNHKYERLNPWYARKYFFLNKGRIFLTTFPLKILKLIFLHRFSLVSLIKICFRGSFQRMLRFLWILIGMKIENENQILPTLTKKDFLPSNFAGEYLNNHFITN